MEGKKKMEGKRKFSGKTFYWLANRPFKSQANEIAARKRKSGRKARVTGSRRSGWDVWVD